MYFSDCRDVNSVKQEYRRLAFIHHPDVGGDTATMQEINAAYHEALNRCDGQSNIGSDGKEHTYFYNEATEQAVMDKISGLLALRLPNIEILLVGTWVWVRGDTRPVKEQLKSVKMGWHSKRKMWFWHTPSYKRRYSGQSFSSICNHYGVASFQSEEAQAIAA